MPDGQRSSPADLAARKEKLDRQVETAKRIAEEIAGQSAV